MPIYNVWGELTFNVSLLVKADNEDDIKNLLDQLTDYDIIEQSLCGEADRDELEENIEELSDWIGT